MTEPNEHVNAGDGAYLDQLYRQWRDDPASVDAGLRSFFQGFELGFERAAAAPPGASSHASATQPALASGAPEPTPGEWGNLRQWRLDQLIYHYRDIGHLAAQLDPLGTQRPFPDRLRPEAFGLASADLDERFDPGLLPLERPARLADIITHLRETYCRTVGVEYMHIQDSSRRRWLMQRMEPVRNRPDFSPDEKMRILGELIEADSFESFLDRRYTAKKRFSLQGGESLVPLLNEIIELGPDLGVEEFALGMAHRGRLNVLVNILHKSYDEIFTEFEEAWTEDFLEGGGDVKYHRGYSAEHTTSAGKPVRLTLSPNPSHLEYVGPVVLGRARAKQRLRGDTDRQRCVPLLIHGDASFPGQGVVAECLNMRDLDGYTVGGTVHVIVNNQVGFTTNQRDLFSGYYCTDIAKSAEAPIFHVNGDDPEACVFVARLALQYRHTFKADAVIDLWCYRKYGHNEGDEPSFTQPGMYERIAAQQPVLAKYAERLIAEGIITRQRFEELSAALHKQLDEAHGRSRTRPVESTIKAFANVWTGLSGEYDEKPLDTTAKREDLLTVSRALGSVPEGFALHPKLERLLEARATAVEDDHPLDWGMGELLAFGTLLMEGHPVRFTGQDVERGTFSHRHAVLFDQKTGEGYEPLNHLREGQAKFCIHNSPLTESACVGFEYGYSLGDPRMLVIWEAQFGDFANGAQVYFDQFIASAEIKWKRANGLTVFLPHGYEGQGPEHSSARLERFLALCADENMIVTYPTTPAQVFHLLRLQMKRSFRKPLIVMTPKSLLRLPAAASTVADLTDGRFRRVIDDPGITDRSRVSRVLLCSGKVSYDLAAHRGEAERDDVAVVRLEQLYPLPARDLREVLKGYPRSAARVWVQEEPRNMGAWRFMREVLHERLDLDVAYVGRDENASPAVASHKVHLQEQKKIMIDAIGLPKSHKTAAAG